MNSKLCKGCSILQPLSNYGKSAFYCATCNKAKCKNYYNKNKEKAALNSKLYREAHKNEIKQASKEYYAKNKVSLLQKDRVYYLANKETVLKKQKIHYSENKEIYALNDKLWRQNNRASKNAINAKRRAAKLNRTPKWLTKFDNQKIQEYYIYAQLLTETLGVKYDVDHIIPLQGENISGLHTPENLQLLTHEENIIKDNIYPWPK